MLAEVTDCPIPWNIATQDLLGKNWESLEKGKELPLDKAIKILFLLAFKEIATETSRQERAL